MSHHVGSSTQELRCSGGSALIPGKLPGGSAKVQLSVAWADLHHRQCGLLDSAEPALLECQSVVHGHSKIHVLD